MNFDYSEEQTFLKDEARRFLAEACPTSVVRAVLDAPERAYDAKMWQQVVEMGWLALAVPERFGGLGLGAVELCAIAEELGRAIAPIPFGSTVYILTQAVATFGTEAQQAAILPRIAAGEVIGCLAVAEGPSVGRSIRTKAIGGRISGEKAPVTDGTIADISIVLAEAEAGPTLFLVPLDHASVKRTPLASLDPTRGIARLGFSDAPGEPLGEPGRGRATLDAILDRAAVPFAFEQVGGAERALEMARDFALERYSFGRPIGSYQAIKHKLADIFVANQIARSNAYFAAWALSSVADALPRAAAAAHAAAMDAYWLAAKEMIETFGGIGATWEADCHLHYRRAKQLGLVLGPVASWKAKLARRIAADF